jgi:hypothetical protein
MITTEGVFSMMKMEITGFAPYILPIKSNQIKYSRARAEEGVTKDHEGTGEGKRG